MRHGINAKLLALKVNDSMTLYKGETTVAISSKETTLTPPPPAFYGWIQNSNPLNVAETL